MSLNFTKMHGLGNDFLIFDALEQKITLSPAQIRWLSDRHLGVGCDQVLVIAPAKSPENDFQYRIFNADGGEVENCGNGARCFARYIHDHQLSPKKILRVETANGIIYPEILANGYVRVDMGPPIFAPEQIPINTHLIALTHELIIGSNTRTLAILSMGNPHAIQIVDNIHQAPVSTEGPLIEQHAFFPKRVNAGFMQIIDPAHIHLRVYERGAGETMACGTGACAAVVAGRLLGYLNENVTVHTRGGTLNIDWTGANNPVYMSGPAEYVFTGTVNVPSSPEI